MVKVKRRSDFPKLFNDMDLRVGAEVGVYEGQFSEYILQNSQISLLYSIDPWEDFDGQPMTIVLEACKKRLLPFGLRSQMMIRPSVKAADAFQDGQLDFVYVDADHRYAMVKADLEAWYPKVKPGGVFAGHDYSIAGRGVVVEQTTKANPNQGRKGVVKAVDEFVALHGVQLKLTRELCKSWWFIKPANNKKEEA